jgi:hypothetical protein
MIATNKQEPQVLTSCNGVLSFEVFNIEVTHLSGQGTRNGRGGHPGGMPCEIRPIPRNGRGLRAARAARGVAAVSPSATEHRIRLATARPVLGDRHQSQLA